MLEIRDLHVQFHGSDHEAVRGIDRPCKADTRDPEYLEHMAMVNNLCSWVRRYLRGYVGMDLKYLQSYLNWYAYLFLSLIHI